MARNLSGLQRNPGRRPRLDHSYFQVRTTSAVKAALEDIALAHGCTYSGGASLSALLNRVAGGQAVIVAAPPGHKRSGAVTAGAVEPVVLALRLASGAKESLEETALAYGLTYGGRGSVAALLGAVAAGELLILLAPSLPKDAKQSSA